MSSKKGAKGTLWSGVLGKKGTKGAKGGQNPLAKLAAAKAAAHKEKEFQDELERQKEIEEAEKEAKRLAELELKAKEEEARIIEEKKKIYQEQKAAGLFKSKKQRLQNAKDDQARRDLEAILKSQESTDVGNKDSKPRHRKKKRQIEAEQKEKNEEVEEDKLEGQIGEKKEEVPEDVEWEELVDDPDKINAFVKPKLSMDLTEITADNPPEEGAGESKESQEDAKDDSKGEENDEAEPNKEETKKEPRPPIKKEEKKEEQEAQSVKQNRTSNEEKKKLEIRAPILCVLGHVDTGKTKILDKIRHTDVQKGEVGGITQQIGASFFPRETLEKHAKAVEKDIKVKIKIPGFLIIDTPGHESFSNLRNRGSTLCDFAILIVDIMHGLENQTIESINILKKYKIPFIVALNKIDRCYDWKPIEYASSKASYERNQTCQQQFDTLTNKVILQFAEQEINACLYWKNEDPETFISMVPTSAITGEGIPDLLTYVVKRIQETLAKRIIYQPKLVCTVMEVKVLEGYGVTCDVILVSGELKVNDTIVLSGFDGAIVVTIRALLIPKPLTEMRVKGEYIHNESVRGAMGVKICAPGLEDALAGSPVYCAHNEEEVKQYKKEAGEELAAMIRKYISKTGEGIYVQSSTLGSLEALLELLKNSKVPVSGIGLGPLYKKHILKVMKASEKKGEKEEYATILAFEVEPDKEANELIVKNGIKLFTAKIVYHLVDAYKKHAGECLYFTCLILVDKEGRQIKVKVLYSLAYLRLLTLQQYLTLRILLSLE
jgi:translation initiation factor 5B